MGKRKKEKEDIRDRPPDPTSRSCPAAANSIAYTFSFQTALRAAASYCESMSLVLGLRPSREHRTTGLQVSARNRPTLSRPSIMGNERGDTTYLATTLHLAKHTAHPASTEYVQHTFENTHPLLFAPLRLK
jgi:hypothetical protein